MARKFRYNGMDLDDPDPQMKPEEVKQVFALTYGELNNASVTGPTKEGDDQVYTFSRAVGAKGAGARGGRGSAPADRDRRSRLA